MSFPFCISIFFPILITLPNHFSSPIQSSSLSPFTYPICFPLLPRTLLTFFSQNTPSPLPSISSLFKHLPHFSWLNHSFAVCFDAADQQTWANELKLISENSPCWICASNMTSPSSLTPPVRQHQEWVSTLTSGRTPEHFSKSVKISIFWQSHHQPHSCSSRRAMTK